ncbi:MAG TPA: ABC transporter substrate-binding protein [Acetobacteraceae bacterium]|nr:ABC transporter substrate-binding protein [Acetobacteraceae bacterium]
MLRLGIALALAAIVHLPLQAAELRVACYSDGNECDVLKELAGPFTASHKGTTIVVDQVPYKAILESLPVQLAAGNGPDIARATDFGALAPYLLDVRPMLPDADYWEKNFGPTLAWMRPNQSDQGIYGLLSQLTVTGPFVNVSLFEQAGVPIPDAKASWDDWAAAAQKVAKATGTPFGMAWDRSGHRFAGPAISYGAKYFAPDGKPAVVDDGFKAMASRFVAWNKDGTVERDVWAATGGGYRDAFEEFANGKIAVYLSGSWQLSRMQTQIGDAFEWRAAPNPCGPAACTGMPGGAAYVALKVTKSPKEVAAFLDYLASAPVYERMMTATANVPAHTGLQSAGLAYNLSPAGKAAMQVFTQSASSLSPIAYKLQGYRYNRVLFDATADRLSQAISGQITLDQALDRITSDVAARLAAAQK